MASEEYPTLTTASEELLTAETNSTRPEPPQRPPAPRLRLRLANGRVAALLEFIKVKRREHLDLMQVAEMRLSEDQQAHTRTSRLLGETEKQRRYWRGKWGADREAAAAAQTCAAELKRHATAAEQETRRANFQILSLQRQLSLLGDAVPPARSMCGYALNSSRR